MSNRGIDAAALTVLVTVLLIATIAGLMAVQGRRGRHTYAPRHTLDEWGLGGRGFGTVTAWFLLGGSLYTAYAFTAVPAAMYSTGAVSGFFAVPYTIIVYPLMFALMPRLWSVAHRNGYITTADFVRGRYDSRALTLVVAVTGILATLPYIALQLVGIQAVFEVAGFDGGTAIRDLPPFLAFALLAAFTYSRGLRAPALMAIIKALLLPLVLAVALVVIVRRVGGIETVFAAAERKMAEPDPRTGSPNGGVIPGTAGFLPYATLTLGSAMALFVYPHSVTAVLAARSRLTVRRNAALLPGYSLMLGLFAVLGFAAIAAGTRPTGMDGEPNAQLVIPQLMEDSFPGWFAGVAFAAIAIAALVPAAIMSIAAANLFARNIYREFLAPAADLRSETRMSKTASLLVKFGALLFVLLLDPRYALDLQLLGGIWILQTFPAIAAGLYTRWFSPGALLAGWTAGMAYGTLTAYLTVNPATGRHFGGSLAELPLPGDHHGYIALTALALNLIVSVVLTVAVRLSGADSPTDRTRAADYHADIGDPSVRSLPELTR
jgi:solute:Na+ symporter, SSS family